MNIAIRDRAALRMLPWYLQHTHQGTVTRSPIARSRPSDRIPVLVAIACYRVALRRMPFWDGFESVARLVHHGHVVCSVRASLAAACMSKVPALAARTVCEWKCLEIGERKPLTAVGCGLLPSTPRVKIVFRRPFRLTFDPPWKTLSSALQLRLHRRHVAQLLPSAPLSGRGGYVQ